MYLCYLERMYKNQSSKISFYFVTWLKLTKICVTFRWRLPITGVALWHGLHVLGKAQPASTAGEKKKRRRRLWRGCNGVAGAGPRWMSYGAASRPTGQRMRRAGSIFYYYLMIMSHTRILCRLDKSNRVEEEWVPCLGVTVAEAGVVQKYQHTHHMHKQMTARNKALLFFVVGKRCRSCCSPAALQ